MAQSAFTYKGEQYQVDLPGDWQDENYYVQLPNGEIVEIIDGAAFPVKPSKFNVIKEHNLIDAHAEEQTFG